MITTKGAADAPFLDRASADSAKLVRGRRFRSFTEARAYVRSLGLKSQGEWREWYKSDNRPPDIPTTPERTYPDEWRGFGDWLGTFKPANRDVRFRPFEEARAYARSLGLKTQKEWREWCKAGRPPDIPHNPERVYSESWRGLRDWLGTENLTFADRNSEYPLNLFHLSISKSQTTHARFKADPSKWWRFHELFRKSRSRWPEEPIEYVAELIRKEVAHHTRLADLGCGECFLREALPEYEITGIDHGAYDAGVIACDMACTPLEDSSFDVAVFCLSLLGRNWPDYLSEARRILRPGGRLIIVESIGRWERMKIGATLEEQLFTEMCVQKLPRSKGEQNGFLIATGKLGA